MSTQTPETAAPPKSAAPPQAQSDTCERQCIISADVLERLRYIAPEYPPRARASGTTGWVNLAFDVEPDGSVTHVAVLPPNRRTYSMRQP